MPGSTEPASTADASSEQTGSGEAEEVGCATTTEVNADEQTVTCATAGADVDFR